MTTASLEKIPYSPRKRRSTSRVVLAFWAALSVAALSNCSNAKYTSEMAAKNESGEIQSQAMIADLPAAPPAAEAIAATTVPKPQPQLIKRAELTLVVQSIPEATDTVAKIVRENQGDLLRFQAQKPQDNSQRHRAFMELRVPQQKLESTLDALAKLGTVANQSITAEDVSQQLVDFQARLRNLRKSEEMVLKIMERSGSVGDVLNAANQLSSIRESIEQIDAQLKNLKNQIAYSTVTVNLEAAVPTSTANSFDLGLKTQESWGQATYAVTQFTLGLVSLAIWLFAFSPYLLILGGGVYGYSRWQQNKHQQKLQQKSQDSVIPESNN